MPDGYQTGVSQAGGFFTGLAEGIFGAQRKRKQQEEEQDLQTRRETLNMLSGMMDQVTPETQPLLLKTIADTMGIKGKERSLWDRFTGQGFSNTRDAMEQKLQSTLANVMPAQQYEELKQQEGISKALGSAFGVKGPLEGATANKIAIRDPQRERMQFMERQKQLDQERLTEIEELKARTRRELQGETFRHRFQMMQDAADIKGRMEVHRLATLKAIQKRGGYATPTDAEFIEAANEVSKLTGLKTEKLLADITKAGAQARQANAAAGSLVPTVDPTTGQTLELTPAQRIAQLNSDRSNQLAAQGEYNKWLGARSQADSIGKELQQIHTQIETWARAKGRTYDATRGAIQDAATGAAAGFVPENIRKLIDKARELTSKKQQAEGQMEGHWNTLKSQYRTYYNFGKNAWTVQPNSQFGGVAPAGAPRATPGPAVYDATTPQPRPAPALPDGVVTSKSPTRHEVGTKIQLGGRTYEVIDVGPVDTVSGMTTYKLKPVSKAGTRRAAPRRADMGRGELP